MSLIGVPPELRAQLDRQHAEYSDHLNRLLDAAALLESTAPEDRAAIILTGLMSGLLGAPEQRLIKAACLASVAIERLSRQERTGP